MADHHKQRGVSLVEILVYTGILVILCSVAVGSLWQLSLTVNSLRSSAKIASSAQIALERVTRDIRGATSVDTSTSTLGTSPGQLTLITTNDSGATSTIQFFLSSTTLRVKDASTDMGPLTDPAVRVTNLIFRRITASKSTAVKIEMTLESGSGKTYLSKKFYSTVTLRGSYPTP